MAFVKVDKSKQVTSESKPIVTMAAHLADGSAHKSKSVSFRVSATLIKQLGWKSDNERIRIGVFEGTDKDIGFLQLMPADDGYSGSSKHESQGVGINVTIERFRHYVLNECPVSSHPVNHMVDGEALIIECPDWLRFNPQTVPQPAPTPITELHTRRGPGRPRRQQG